MIMLEHSFTIASRNGRMLFAMTLLDHVCSIDLCEFLCVSNLK
jgi:hypothetical protein